jgi:hypothetical protein
MKRRGRRHQANTIAKLSLLILLLLLFILPLLPFIRFFYSLGLVLAILVVKTVLSPLHSIVLVLILPLGFALVLVSESATGVRKSESGKDHAKRKWLAAVPPPVCGVVADKNQVN